jgi:hypothetical protein
MLVCNFAIWSILLPFGLHCGNFGIFYGYLVCFSHFGMLYQEKSGNTGALYGVFIYTV